ncbi:MAG: ester cyclase [Armatimonadetes bacterium]|nr:ester cyclase [Armatimonadota bacterium]
MSTERTRETMEAYLDALMKRGAYGQYFTDAVTFTLMGSGQAVQGQPAVEGFIRFLHEQAFDAQPRVRTVISGDGQAALEADFIGTHAGEFLGVPATGRSVHVPYSVTYDLAGDKITALRVYMPMDVLMQQLSASAPAPAGA